MFYIKRHGIMSLSSCSLPITRQKFEVPYVVIAVLGIKTHALSPDIDLPDRKHTKQFRILACFRSSASTSQCPCALARHSAKWAPSPQGHRYWCSQFRSATSLLLDSLLVFGKCECAFRGHRGLLCSERGAIEQIGRSLKSPSRQATNTVTSCRYLLAACC